MKVLLVLAAAMVVAVSAIPVFEEIGDLDDELYRRSAFDEFVEDMPVEDELLRQRRSLSEADFEEVPFEDDADHGLRLKRATCDALSFSSKWITVNHSACAIHCIAKGYKGGKCVDTICNCRR